MARPLKQLSRMITRFLALLPRNVPRTVSNRSALYSTASIAVSWRAR